MPYRTASTMMRCFASPRSRLAAMACFSTSSAAVRRPAAPGVGWLSSRPFRAPRAHQDVQPLPVHAHVGFGRRARSIFDCSWSRPLVRQVEEGDVPGLVEALREAHRKRRSSGRPCDASPGPARRRRLHRTPSGPRPRGRARPRLPPASPPRTPRRRHVCGAEEGGRRRSFRRARSGSRPLRLGRTSTRHRKGGSGGAPAWTSSAWAIPSRPNVAWRFRLFRAPPARRHRA